ncbi:MAG: hypothetical protein RLP15_01235 [Cryomorphaceae bacterium]
MPNLKLALATNALFSGICACIALVLAPEISTWMGIHNAWIIRIIGGGLMLFCLSLITVIGKAEPPIYLVLSIIALDLLWVLGSIVILMFPPTAFNESGETLITFMACLVGFLASWQFSAIWKR